MGLWAKIRGKVSRVDIMVWESVLFHPTRMNRQKHFTAAG